MTESSSLLMSLVPPPFPSTPGARRPVPLRRWVATWAGILPWLALLGARMAFAAEPETTQTLETTPPPPPPRTDVAVLYNRAHPESRGVAEHYASRRAVPTNHLIGLDLPLTETISRADYQDRLEGPLVRELEHRDLAVFRDRIVPATETTPGRIVRLLTQSAIRYFVVCHGVPLRITQDPVLREPDTRDLPEPLRRNEAAVDAELTALPLLLSGQPRNGPIQNPWLGTTNAAQLQPLQGVFLVGRLDGPTPDIARGLVDRALEAETNGLLGRGYFDMRGALPPAYQPGDQWISNAWAIATSYGFDTHLDTRPETLEPGFPLSHVALYAGWYDTKVSGPFTLPQVEFMPGAIAYHLYSFSASTLRSPSESWTAAFLQKGVTATLGAVAEPFLDGTPDIGLCLARLLFSGFTWGEATLASQRMLSWQLTVLGDPLYRPFALHALDRAKDLSARGQGRVDWALVTLYNRKRRTTADLDAIVAELRKEPRLRFSPILEEKLADFLRESGQHAEAAEWYRRAGAWRVSPQQRKRLLWSAAEALQAAGKTAEAYAFYAELARTTDPAPQPIVLHDRLRSLANALNKTEDAAQWSAILDRLRSPTRSPQ